jgi:xanthosine utilization system XapX-like protein
MLRNRDILSPDFVLIAVPLVSSAVVTLVALAGIYTFEKTVNITRKVIR